MGADQCERRPGAVRVSSVEGGQDPGGRPVNAPDAGLPSASTAPSHAERLFPTLTEAQVQRIAAQGLRRQTTKGEMLVEVGEASPFFVVVRGSLQVLSSSAGVDTGIVTHGPGEFTGEANLITGRP